MSGAEMVPRTQDTVQSLSMTKLYHTYAPVCSPSIPTYKGSGSINSGYVLLSVCRQEAQGPGASRQMCCAVWGDGSWRRGLERTSSVLLTCGGKQDEVRESPSWITVVPLDRAALKAILSASFQILVSAEQCRGMCIFRP